MTREIIFYGQDHSPIDEAFYEEVSIDSQYRVTSKNRNIKSFAEDDKNLETLINALIDLDSKLNNKLKKKKQEDTENDSLLVVGHTHEKDDDFANQEYHIYDASIGEHGFFGSLVGTVRTKVGKQNVKIVIRSRFDDFDPVHPDETKPYFLASLLLSGELEFSSAAVDFSYDSLFHFYMIWVLKKHFQDALLKGLFKKYQRFERNDDRVRGAIDVSRHIRLNLGMNNGKIAYSYRENSYDNPINHLILTAYHYLSDNYPDLTEKGFDYDLVKTIKSLEYETGYPKYDVRSVISANIDPVSHPYYFEYEQLRKDCLMILRDEGLSPFDNTDESVYGVLYYVPDLWESYLMQFFKSGLYRYYKEASEDEADDEPKLMIRIEDQKKVKVMNVPDDREGAKGKNTYPDFWFTYSMGEDGKQIPFAILDAKYKTGWEDALDGDLPSDLLGDYDKCLRDMVSAGGTSAGVVFPCRAVKTDPVHVHRCSGYNDFQCFYTFPVNVPSSGEYDDFYDWESDMNEATIDLMEQIVEKFLVRDAERKKALLNLRLNAFRELGELEV